MSADCSRTPPLVISRLFCTLLHNLLGLTVLTADDVDTLLDTVHQLTAQVVDNVTAILLDIYGANTRGVVQLEVNRLGTVGGTDLKPTFPLPASSTVSIVPLFSMRP